MLSYDDIGVDPLWWVVVVDCTAPLFLLAAPHDDEVNAPNGAATNIKKRQSQPFRYKRRDVVYDGCG